MIYELGQPINQVNNSISVEKMEPTFLYDIVATNSDLNGAALVDEKGQVVKDKSVKDEKNKEGKSVEKYEYTGQFCA